MSDKNKKGKRTTAELKAMADRYRNSRIKLQEFKTWKTWLHTNRFVQVPPEARSVDHFSCIDGNPGSNELLRGAGSYQWKGLHPDLFMGG